MKKAVIFCAGSLGQRLFEKLSLIFNIIAYCDNNQSVWGSNINGVPIISTEELSAYEECSIIICNTKITQELINQIYKIGFKDILISQDGIVYNIEKGLMLPFKNSLQSYKKNGEKLSVLFVQDSPCIRTKRMAKLLKSNGCFAALAYTVNIQKPYDDCFDETYPIYSYSDLIEFVNNSDFDVVHSSNEPDNLTNILLATNKKIIHDTHDMMSIRSVVEYNEMTLEYIANTKSAGLMYTTEAIRDIAIKKFSINSSKTFAIENMLFEEIGITNKFPKLSQQDSEIHCVYEGGISDNSKHIRFFELQWKKITNAGIHIHFYSHQNIDYCKRLDNESDYLHYEGNISDTFQLINEMTKYDIGLLILESDIFGNQNVKLTSANKLFEYLNAGLPVAVDGIGAYSNTAIEHNVGMTIDFNEDLYPQFEKLKQIVVPDNFISDNKFTIESRTQEILDFYRKIANS
ncbi:MAG: hypothetical protein LBM93_12350 [Oscillospiraceae bacterium]|jgi:hypothetical protein|nr:hypothetical protein [Oscillospiraceae bacterium]